MNSLSEFKRYISKLRYVEAVKVDEKWHDFLRKEQGYSSVNIGDYYVKQCDGNYIVLTAERFTRLFEEEKNYINEANSTFDNLIFTGKLPSGE
jgi:hypothetical protein